MADEIEISPDDFQILTANDGSHVRLLWGKDTGERVAVTLDRSQLPSVLLEVQKQIEPGSAVPINLGSLRPGATYKVTGLGFGPRTDHFSLTVFLDLPDQGRGVELPLALSRKDVEDCISLMGSWLSRQSKV